MNTHKFRSSVLALALILAAPLARSAETRIKVDCAHRARLGQADVARGLGIDNIGQAYDARARLRGVVARACHRAQDGRFDLVLRTAPARPVAATGDAVASVR